MKAARPDVDLLDLKMPEAGGPRRPAEYARDLPKARIVVFTIYENPAYVNTALRGRQRVRAKNVGAKKLLEQFARLRRRPLCTVSSRGCCCGERLSKPSFTSAEEGSRCATSRSSRLLLRRQVEQGDRGRPRHLRRTGRAAEATVREARCVRPRGRRLALHRTDQLTARDETAPRPPKEDPTNRGLATAPQHW